MQKHNDAVVFNDDVVETLTMACGEGGGGGGDFGGLGVGPYSKTGAIMVSDTARRSSDSVSAH